MANGVSKTKKILMTVAIALVLVFFVAYATESIYPSPEYDKYCPIQKSPVMYETQETCEAVGGSWSQYEEIVEPKAVPVKRGYCDAYYTCNKEYNDDREVYERNVFFINLIAGLIVIGISFLISVEVVSNGFIGAGVILLVYGTIRNWSNLSAIWRTLMLGVALVVLIWIGYRKLRD